METVRIYTDGACTPNPGRGGWCFAVVKHGQVELTWVGGEEHTTNNRMEYMAAVAALSIVSAPHVVIYSDSQLLVNTMNLWLVRWLKSSKALKKKKNIDLVKKLHELSQDRVVEWVWIKGHNGNVMNELVDQHAVQASLTKRSGTWTQKLTPI